MKNKPTRHKESNTFRFQPFSKRISNLDVDVFHRIGHKNEEYDEEETYLHQTIQKWNLLNLSECYEELRKELPLVQTLPMLLNKRDVVINIILKHLVKRNPLSLQAVLDLLAALMKDLRREVYTSYGIILQRLCELLSTKDADELEWTFTCLAYMFKYLWRYIVKDLDTVFDSLVPLFSNSKPQYIRNFAAESFAYVVRKVKNKEEFVKLLLVTLESRSDSIEGCGRMIFEVMRGIRGRFHSFAHEFLPLVIEMLYDTSVNSLLLYNLLEHMFSAMCTTIDRKYFSLVWTTSFNVIFKHQESNKNTESEHLILKLIKQVINFKDGVLLVEPQLVVTNILKFLETVEHEEISMILSEIVAKILMSSNVHLSQECARRLTTRALMVPYEQSVLDFICQVLQYPGFDTFIKPWVQNYVCSVIQKDLTSSSSTNTTSNNAVYYLLPRIVLEKATPCLHGINLEAWEQYPLDLTIDSGNETPGKKECVFETLLHERYSNISTFKDNNNEELISMLLVLPHIKMIQKEVVHKTLRNLMTKLCSELYTCSNDVELKETVLHEMLFLFLIVLEAHIHVMDFQDVEEVCSVEFMLNTVLPFARQSCFMSALHAIDLYFTAMNLEERDCNSRLQVLEKMYASLSENLLSPYHKVRLLTSHIFSLFATSNSENEFHFFKLCFEAESISVSIQNVRDKLMILEKLSFEVIGVNNKYMEVPLQYLLGVFYVNFQLLWEPVMHLIVTYARGMPLANFWKVFETRLRKAAQNILVGYSCVIKKSSYSNVIFTEMYDNLHKLEDRPDDSNYRILLWKTLAEFPDFYDLKSRDVSPLLLNFLEEEYFKVNSNDVQFCNIQQLQSSDCNDDDDDDSDSEQNKSCTNQKKKSVEKSKHVQLYQSLLVHMTVFTKVRNPRGIFKESQLRYHFFNLLTRKNPHIQKIALDCLMTYKEKYLEPYSEHMYGLLNDKTFKDVITLFRIDKETTVVQPEHREGLFPIVIRIVYGRMTGRSSSSAELRRSQVLRFLAGCHENEMLIFLKLVFRVYLTYLHDDAKTIVEDIMRKIDLKCVIPLKTLRSSVNMLLIIMEKFGSLMSSEVLSFMLRILISIGALISSILACRTEIYPAYASGIRSLQNTLITAAAKFFSHFTDYPWTPEGLDAIFMVSVWPGLEKLPIEGIHSPTALLKLFLTWSRDPRYFYLLIKHKDCTESNTPLGSVMKLLLAPKIMPTVTISIVEMIEALLTTADYTEEYSEEQQTKAFFKKEYEELNYGTKILLPYVPVIIKYLQHKLTIKKKKGLGSRDLLILSRVCELEVDAETSENLLKLLFLAFLKKVDGPEQTVVHLVSTICSLLKNVSAPFEYLKYIAPLFGTVSAVSARKMLCNLLTELAKKDSELNKENLLENVQLILDINAWDAKWIEQPDFGRRLDGFKSVHKMVEKESIILNFGLIIVYNCFFILKSQKDLSLKDSAGYCLRKLCPFLCKQAMVVKNSHIPESILQQIIAGIREKSNDSVRDETITLLGVLVRECCDAHTILLDLKDLACKEDEEVDFFNNMIHLQSHRRARALMRFCSIAKQMVKPPQTHTMTQVMLPLVSSFLCTEKYSKKKNVIDAAVTSIGIVCNFLPWVHYEPVLRFYLNKLHTVPEYQKQLVRVVISILDAFRFDVSLAVVPEDKNIKKSNVQTKKDSQKETHSQINEKESCEEIQVLQGKQQGENADLGTEKKGEEKSGEGDKSMGEQYIGVDATVAGDVTTATAAGEDNDVTKQSAEEELEDVMDNVSVGENEETEEKEIALPTKEPFILKPVKLPVSVATKVIRSMTRGLLPQLQRTITLNQKSSVHKVNRKKTAAEQEEEDTMCIPVALAIVKLLQRLPSQYLDHNLPGVFFNICTYLKSRLQSVRRVAREMLQKIMESLGPSYLRILLNEMIALLTKGFQKHVLIYTIHSVLTSVKATLRPGDMDACLSYLWNICKMDLFGISFEEKNVAQIVGKVAEARSHKSYDTLNIAAQCITEKCFIDLLLPLKDILITTHSHSTLGRVSESLHRIVLGLNDNRFVSVESLLMFIYGVVSGSIDAFKMECEKTVVKETQRKLPNQPDTFIIPQAPRTRYGTLTAKPNLSSDRNAHLLVEFGFRLFHILLKKGKAVSNEIATYIDPLIPILQKNIDSKHVKLATVTIQCLVKILKMDLPNLKTNINVLSNSLFNLLHKYATAGLSQGEYFDMVIAAFKAVTVLVGDVKYHVINDLQLKSLLLYIEQGMQDFKKQATAFPLLKAILSRKLDVPEVYEVLKNVAQLSIISEHDQVRAQARQVFYHFLMNYPLGHRVEVHVNFYISQLNYELEPGRLSAFRIIHRMIATFPDDALSKYAGVFFVAIGASLVNDEMTSCKKMAANCLKTLLTRDETDRDRLFNVTSLWMKDQKIAHRRLGAQMCGIFVEVETEKFLRRLDELFPVLQTLLTARVNLIYAPGKCVRLAQEANESEEVKEKKLRLEDHCIYQVLRLIKKICSLCPTFVTDDIWMQHVEIIGEAVQSLLSHPHQWIRLEASAVLGYIFASLNIKALVETISSTSFIEGRYLFHDTGSKLKSLVLDFCDQLIPDSTCPQLIEQVTKNLAFLCRVIQAVPEDAEITDESGVKVSLLWLIRKMRKMASMEVVKAPFSYTVREAVFKWIGALVVDLTKERLQSVISQVLIPLGRELLLEEQSHPDLLHLAKGVVKIIKKKLGVEEYTNQLSKIQAYLDTKRAMRRKERVQQVIHNPELAAKRKIKRQQKKKILKKRKMDEWKGRVAPRRKRKVNNNLDSEYSAPKKNWHITEVAPDA